MDSQNMEAQAAENQQPETPTVDVQPPKRGIRKWLKIGLPVAAAVAVTTGVLVYNNTPAQRFIRSVNSGIKSLQELDYESAKASFSSAIEIDSTDLEAYLGLLISCSGLNDKAGLKEAFDAAINQIKEGFEGYTDENRQTALEILRYVREVYGDDIYKEIEATELAFSMYPDNEEFKSVLIDDYFIAGGKSVDARDYAKGIELLEKAMELAPDNTVISDRRNRAVKDYIAHAFDAENFDLVLELCNKYKGEVPDINENFINAEIKEINRIKEEDKKNVEFMKTVYETMSTEDYESMLSMYNSEDCKSFLQRMYKKVYYYFPDGNASKNGMGAACYYSDRGYYFYYGNFSNGSREGNGTTFRGDTDYLYTYFNGNWSGNKPNGAGTEKTRASFYNTGGVYEATTEGSLTNGHWDGHITHIICTNGLSFDCSFSAVDGIPTEDKTDAFPAKDYWYSNYSHDVAMVYAFDQKEWQTVWSNYSYGFKLGTPCH
ncbi:MAG: hypothetical protein K6F75_02535 [Butyrivibrio sp.]|nr:hypothetical protein [Butyrivibrio sp.]